MESTSSRRVPKRSAITKKFKSFLNERKALLRNIGDNITRTHINKLIETETTNVRIRELFQSWLVDVPDNVLADQIRNVLKPEEEEEEEVKKEGEEKKKAVPVVTVDDTDMIMEAVKIARKIHMTSKFQPIPSELRPIVDAVYFGKIDTTFPPDMAAKIHTAVNHCLRHRVPKAVD